MSMFCIILLTLVIYSVIGTIAFILLSENEDVGIAFGIGIVGLVLSMILNTIHFIKRKFKYHIGKRSIFEEEVTGVKFKCKTKDANDVLWADGYKMIKRYATKSEWDGIPDFSEKFMNKCKINCDHCKHDKECSNIDVDRIKCKHNEWGNVLEFDKFEKK